VTDRVFLEANVLFSAAWREEAGLLRLGDLADVVLLTSLFALEEVRRNLSDETRRERLRKLLASVTTMLEAPDRPLPQGMELAEKDRPILRAALEGRCTHLLTGDRRDFGHSFGRLIEGCRILPPVDYLRGRQI
jgi:hypothetical protein